MKVVEFLRVSTQEQGNDDRAGLSRQREANERTISRNKLELAETIQLIDVSGTSVMHAPEMKRLLSLISRDDIKGVVVADADRLFRPDNFRDFELLQSFIETDTVIYTSDQVINLRTQGGFLLAGIQAIISGNELTQIKKRMLDAKEIKRRNGEHPNSKLTLPLGVDYDREKNKFFYTEDGEKVRQLFELFHAKGFQNYRELEKLTNIPHRTIANLLRNELYIGYRTYTEKRSPEKNIKMDGRQGDRKKIKRKPDEIIRVRVIENPLVQEDVFHDVQNILRKKRGEYHKKKSKEGQRFLYSGFLRCGVCGDIMYSHSGGVNPKKDYYCCRRKSYSFKHNHDDRLRCKSSYVQKEFIEHSITAFVSNQLTDVSYITKLVEKTYDAEEIEKAEREGKRLKEKIKSIEKERSKCLDLYAKDLFSEDELDVKVTNLNNEKLHLNRRLEEIEYLQQTKGKSQINERIRQVVDTLFEFEFWTPSQKRALLRSQLPEFTVTKEGITDITVNFCKLSSHEGRGSSPPRA